MIEVNGGKLYQFFNMLTKVCGEFLLNIDEAGLWYRTVDPSNVCMQECHIEKSNCLQFSEDDKQVGMCIDRIMPFIKEHKKDTSICMDFQLINADDRTYKLVLTSNGSSIEVTCPSPNVIRRQPNVPSFNSEPCVTIVITAKEMKQCLKNVCASSTRRHSDCIGFFVVDKTMTVLNRDKDIKYGTTVRSNASGSWNCHFSYDYLKEYLSVVDTKEVLHIDLRTDHPVFIRAQNMDSNLFLLAPRIEPR